MGREKGEVRNFGASPFFRRQTERGVTDFPDSGFSVRGRRGERICPRAIFAQGHMGLPDLEDPHFR